MQTIRNKARRQRRLRLELRRLTCIAGVALGFPGLAGAADLSVTVVDTKGAGIEDAVVFVSPLEKEAPATPADSKKYIIEQKDGEFVPYVSVVRLGTRVEFPNRDQVQHHVYSLSAAKRFETPLHGGDESYGEVMDKTGVVSIGCNIHDWMIAYVVVLDTPWFGRSDPSGKASIKELPTGRYRLEIWHPRLSKPISEELIVNDGHTSRNLTLALKPDRRIRRALEGKAGGYK